MNWRPMVRIARRDALRFRGRSLLVLVMIALPVLAVTAADVVLQTRDISGAESADRRLGTADARVTFEGTRDLQQMPDPDAGSGSTGYRRSTVDPTVATIETVLGREVRGVERRDGTVMVSTDRGAVPADATETDLGDPLTTGLFGLTEGRLPQNRGEVVVNSALAARGPGVGEELRIVDGPTATVVGVAESAVYRSTPVVAGPLGSLALPQVEGTATWLIDTDAPVSWAQVRQLNGLGALVLSRTVLENPPSTAELAEAGFGPPSDSGTYAVLALIVVMVLLEVVLLAGPAFAVGARRQQRTLALVAATGGTPRQMRRVVLATALVLGGTAAVLGVAGGIGVAFAVLPLAQSFAGTWFGPFDIPWWHVLGIAAFGLLSAVLAAVVPAVLAARQDVVQVLAGRRGDRAPGAWSPVLGGALLAAGVAGAIFGANRPSGEFLIAASTVLSVLGMILLVPVVLATAGRLAHRAPLPIRYAVRDAARHRTRTVPAVAAVAATVVGVVALGIGASSDELQNERTYTPTLAHGAGAVSTFTSDSPDWAKVQEAVHAAAPGNRVTPVRGIPEQFNEGRSSRFLSFNAPGSQPLLDGYNSPFATSVLVSPDGVPAGIIDLTDRQRDAAKAMLVGGGAVVVANRAVNADKVRVSTEYWNQDGRPRQSRPVTLPALYLEVPGSTPPLQAVLPPHAAALLDAEPTTVGLTIDGPISQVMENDIDEAVNAIDPDISFYVERGYQAGEETQLALLILGTLGAVLMLGGTLTATFLALSDAKPDLATLSAVGAAPRTRRGVAAGYAGVVGGTGALLGAAIGFVPGIAVTYPLTNVTWTNVDTQGQALPDHFLDIPWLLIGAVVVLLPILTAMIVGITARGRLPLVARLD
jgi:putative ABC transport system permease protein